MDMEKIRKLAEIAKEFELTTLEVDKDRVLMERVGKPAGYVPPAAPVSVSTTLSGVSAFPEPETPGTPVKASLVGVFYAAPAPGEPPFVKVGDIVKKGDTLCIIEAMKLMNEIPADCDGEIAEICARDGQVVDFGQILFRVV